MLLLLFATGGVSSSLLQQPFAAANCAWPAVNGTGIRGNAYSNLHEAKYLTVEGCCSACMADQPKCAGWELKIDPKSGMSCNLKPKGSAAYANAACTSGMPAPPPVPKCPSAARPPPGHAAKLKRIRLLPKATKAKPHVFMFLQDDLGHDDVAFYGNTVNEDVTANITAAAKEGIVLNRHYVHWHCSPTRRTFLTGRLPLHHSEFLSPINTGDDIDLRWATIAQKLKKAGYANYWFGKGHTGYKSYNHLPLQLGFDAFTGFLGGAEDHFSGPRWAGNCPQDPKNETYSAMLYGELAHATLEAYDETASDAKPLFFYLPWQNVHAPYQAPVAWTGDVLRGMLDSTDAALGAMVMTLKAKGMWDNSVLFYSADNGGTDRGSNWPLRGSKHSNWEGGMRGAAFISGGLIPAVLRGSSSNVAGHIADWYSTICVLAGVDFKDDSPIKPLPVDPTEPSKDIYSNGAYPGVDGVDMWPFWVTTPSTDSAAAHPDGLWLSTEVMVLGDYKLVVAQQDPAKTNSGPTLGWKCGGAGHSRCNTTVSAECGENPDTKGPKTKQCNTWVKATPEQCKCGCDFNKRNVSGATPFVPCLFDVASDPSEFSDISAAQGAIRTQLWAKLNLSNLEQFQHRGDTKSPEDDPSANRSPEKLTGPCNPECAQKYWAQWGSKNGGGPNCGVPGCGEPPAGSV